MCGHLPLWIIVFFLVLDRIAELFYGGRIGKLLAESNEATLTILDILNERITKLEKDRE